jgi:hypothetical protein
MFAARLEYVAKRNATLELGTQVSITDGRDGYLLIMIFHESSDLHTGRGNVGRYEKRPTRASSSVPTPPYRP